MFIFTVDVAVAFLGVIGDEHPLGSGWNPWLWVIVLVSTLGSVVMLFIELWQRIPDKIRS